jgi:dolichyl-phosphate-mannose--protein O-mannosyl transferase
MTQPTKARPREEPKIPSQSDSSPLLKVIPVIFVLIACCAYFVLLPLHLYSGDIDSGSQTFVTCGSAIKLRHAICSCRLHSHPIGYSKNGISSGQQSVTCVHASDDSNSLWIVKPAHHMDACDRGQPIANDAVLRLEHVNTEKNLHSHGKFSSPISGMQEVSAFGDSGIGDFGDNFIVSWDTKFGSHWRQGVGVNLQHVETKRYVSCDPRYVYSHPIPGQLEVSCGSDSSFWVADAGVYFKLPDS